MQPDELTAELPAQIQQARQRLAELRAARRGERVEDVLARLDEPSPEDEWHEAELALMGSDEVEADRALWKIIEGRCSLAQAIEHLCIIERGVRAGIMDPEQLHQFRTNPRLIFLPHRAGTLLTRYRSWAKVPESVLYRADVSREELRQHAVEEFQHLERDYVDGIRSTPPEVEDPRLGCAWTLRNVPVVRITLNTRARSRSPRRRPVAGRCATRRGPPSSTDDPSPELTTRRRRCRGG